MRFLYNKSAANVDERHINGTRAQHDLTANNKWQCGKVALRLSGSSRQFAFDDQHFSAVGKTKGEVLLCITKCPLTTRARAYAVLNTQIE